MRGQQYILSVVQILIVCCVYMVRYPRRKYPDGIYKEHAKQIIRDLPSLWRLLWAHRHSVLGPQTGNPEEICAADAKNDGLSGVLISLFREVDTLETIYDRCV